MTENHGRRITRLRITDFMRIEAADIVPGDRVTVVAGPNGAGKSSVLQAIWYALQGRAAARGIPQPIRSGADRATVVMDLGDMTVTRKITQGKSTLTVRSNGVEYSSPQAMLDGMLADLAFDPLAFARKRPDDQARALLQVLGLEEEMNRIAGLRRAAFEDRTSVGRDLRTLEASLADWPEDPGAPAEERSITDALRELEQAQDAVAAYRKREAGAQAITDRIEEIGRLIEQLEAERTELVDTQLETFAELDEEQAQLPDVEQMARLIHGLEEANARARKASDRRVKASQLDGVKAIHDGLTETIATFDETKRSLVAGADLPLDGLAITEEGQLTYRGIPLEQCSTSEQLRVGAAIGMAMDPDIRVLQVRDGSLLDTESLAELGDLADRYDTQVWVEVVAGPGDDPDLGVPTFIIEEGTVRSSREETP